MGDLMYMAIELLSYCSHIAMRRAGAKTFSCQNKAMQYTPAGYDATGDNQTFIE
jgi:hypothetical protein